MRMTWIKLESTLHSTISDMRAMIFFDLNVFQRGVDGKAHHGPQSECRGALESRVGP